MINSGLYSSATSEWATPQALFDQIQACYGTFTLDPCATAENAKCSRYFTKDDDGLEQPWSKSVFMNPPYGREIGLWVEKAHREAERNDGVVVCLLPARTDTAWWHTYCMDSWEICFIRGRVHFGGSKNSAPFPSAIVVFRRGCGYGPPVVDSWELPREG